MPISKPDTTPRTRIDTALLFAFLAYLPAACLVLGPFADINAPKWFIIRAIGPLLLAACWFHAAATGRRLIDWNPLSILAVAFLALHVLSLAVATNIGYGLERISNLVGLIATFFLVSHLGRDRAARTAILGMLLVIGAATAAYGIAQHHGYDFFDWQTNARSEREVPVDRGVSFFGHATFSASVLIQIIPIGIGLALASGWFGRILALSATAAMLYHLSFSGARMATLAFLASTFAAALVWLWLRRSREQHAPRRFVRTAAAIGIILVVGASVGGWFAMRAWQVKGSDLFAIRQSSMALRIFNWETASRMIYAHPVLGVGAGNYEIVSPKYWNEVEQFRLARHNRWMQQAHNDYLQTAAELGLPGVTVLLGLFAYAVVLALNQAARAPDPRDRWLGLALFASVAAIALDANTTFSLLVPGSALVWWVVLGLISAATGGSRSIRPVNLR